MLEVMRRGVGNVAVYYKLGIGAVAVVRVWLWLSRSLIKRHMPRLVCPFGWACQVAEEAPRCLHFYHNGVGYDLNFSFSHDWDTVPNNHNLEDEKQHVSPAPSSPDSTRKSASSWINPPMCSVLFVTQSPSWVMRFWGDIPDPPHNSLEQPYGQSLFQERLNWY